MNLALKYSHKKFNKHQQTSNHNNYHRKIASKISMSITEVPPPASPNPSKDTTPSPGKPQSFLPLKPTTVKVKSINQP